MKTKEKPKETKKFQFKLLLEYEVEAESEDDAIDEFVDLIKQDYIYYADEGEITEVKS